MRAFDTRTSDEILVELVPTVDAAARQALALCRETMACVEPDDAAAELDVPSETRSNDRIVQVGDIAFIGATELRSTLERLASIARSSREERLEECQRVLRRVVKTLSALDLAIAAAASEPVTVTVGDELLRSIATRRHYARLRRVIVGYPAPEDVASSRRAFERVRLHLKMLIESDEYGGLRLADRRQVDELCVRLGAQLGVRADAESHLEDCKRLWQDVLGFARLVAAINRRHELVESDTAVVASVHQILSVASEIPPRVRARLDRLAGLDDGVDRLLDAGDWSAASWRSVVSELHERLVRPATGRFRAIPEPLA